MRKNVVINGVTYNSVPQVEIPLAGGGGNAIFYDTTDGTAVAADILSGKTAYSSGLITGSMTDNGAVSGTISTKAGTYTVPRGYHDGNGSVSISSSEQNKLVTGNIKSGVTILGVSGKASVVDTSDGTATARQILSGQTAYVNGSKLTGSLTAATVSQDGATKVLTIS